MRTSETDREHISNDSVIAHYRHFLLNLTEAFEGSNASIGHAQLAENIEHLIRFELNLEKAYLNAPRSDDFEGTLEQFQVGATHNKVQWLKMLRQIQANFGQQTKGTLKIPAYSEHTTTKASDIHYINEVIVLLESTPQNVIQNYFATALALNYGTATSSKVREAIYHYTGLQEIQNVRTSCATMAQNWPLIMGRVYVDTHFTRPEKVAATRLVSELRASFRENLEKRNQWLDEATRKYAIEKLDAISAEVGYPEWILDNEQVDNFYPYLKTIDLQKGKFLENVISLRAASWQIEITPLEQKNKTG